MKAEGHFSDLIAGSDGGASMGRGNPRRCGGRAWWGRQCVQVGYFDFEMPLRPPGGSWISGSEA